MTRIVLSLLIGLLTLALAAPAAARPTGWAHVCVYPYYQQVPEYPNDDLPVLVTSYGHVSGPGMNTAEARYWTEWCEDEVSGQVRGVRPYPSDQ
jgi:hypothetical protein